MPDTLDDGIRSVQELIDLLERGRAQISETSAQFENLTNILQNLRGVSREAISPEFITRINQAIEAIRTLQNTRINLGETGRFRTGAIGQALGPGLPTPEEVENLRGRIEALGESFTRLRESQTQGTAGVPRTQEEMVRYLERTGEGLAQSETQTRKAGRSTQDWREQLRSLQTTLNVEGDTIERIIADLESLNVQLKNVTASYDQYNNALRVTPRAEGVSLKPQQYQLGPPRVIQLPGPQPEEVIPPTAEEKVRSFATQLGASNEVIEKAINDLRNLGTEVRDVSLNWDHLNQILRVTPKVEGLTVRPFQYQVGQPPPVFNEARIQQVLGQALSQRVVQTAGQAGFNAEDLRQIDEYANSYRRLSFVQQESEGITRRLIVTTDQYGNVLVDTQKRFRGFFSTIQRNIGEMIKWSAAVVLVWGPLRKLSELVNTAIDNQTKLADIGVVLGKSQEDLRGVFDAAADAAQATGEGINGVLEGYTQAYRATGNITNQTERAAVTQKLMTDALVLSKLSALDQAQALDTLVGGLRQLGKELDQGEELLNRWVAVSRASAVGIDTLAESYAIASTTAQSAGIELDQLNGIVATLAEQTTLSATEVGNSVRAIISGLQTDPARQQLENFGIAVTDLETGELRPFLDVIEEINARFRAGIISERQIQQIGRVLGGGVRRGTQVEVVIKNLDRIKEVAAASAEAQGSAYDALDIQLNTIGTSLTRLSNQFSELAQAMGEEGGILSVLQLILDVSTNLLSIFEDLTRTIGAATPIIAGALALYGYLGQTGRAAAANRAFDFVTSRGTGPLTNLLAGGIANPRTAGRLGGLGIGALAATPQLIQGIQSGDRQQIQEAGITFGTAAIGALIAGPIGSVVGAAIGSTFVESVLNREPDFQSFFADILVPEEAKPPTESPEDRAARLEREAIQIAYERAGGGGEGAAQGGQFRATLLAGIVNAITGGQRLLGINPQTRPITPEQAALFSSGGNFGQIDPEVLRRIQEARRSREGTRGYEAEDQTLRFIQEQTQEREKQLQLLQQISQEQRDALRSDLIAGSITTQKYTAGLEEISTLIPQATTLFTAFGEEFIKITDNVDNADDAYRAFADILVRSTPEATQLLFQLSNEIAQQENNWDNLGEAGRDALQKLRQEAAQAAEVISTALQYQDIELPSVIDFGQIEQDAEFAWTQIGQRAVEIMRREWEAGVAAGVIDPELSFEVWRDRLPTIFFEFGQLAGINFKDGFTAQSVKDAFDQLVEQEILTKVEDSGRKAGLRFLDISSGQFGQLGAIYNRIRQQVIAQGAGGLLDERDMGVILNDYVTKTIHADMTLLNLAMQELIDLNKDQLDGIYNLPTDASFYVPFTGYELGFRNRGAGGAGGTGGFPAATGTGGARGVENRLDTTNNILTQIRDGLTQVPAADVAYEQRRELLQRRLVPQADIQYEERRNLLQSQGRAVPQSDLAYEQRRELLIGQTGISLQMRDLLRDVQRNLPNTPLFDVGPGAGEDVQSNLQSSLSELNRNVAAISDLETRLQLEVTSNTTLILDGRTLATALKPYLFEDILRYEGTSGTISKTVVI